MLRELVTVVYYFGVETLLLQQVKQKLARVRGKRLSLWAELCEQVLEGSLSEALRKLGVVGRLECLNLIKHLGRELSTDLGVTKSQCNLHDAVQRVRIGKPVSKILRDCFWLDVVVLCEARSLVHVSTLGKHLNQSP